MRGDPSNIKARQLPSSCSLSASHVSSKRASSVDASGVWSAGQRGHRGDPNRTLSGPEHPPLCASLFGAAVHGDGELVSRRSRDADRSRSQHGRGAHVVAQATRGDQHADGDDRRRGGTMTVATLPVDVRAGGRV
jgi:hypothetical protein